MCGSGLQNPGKPREALPAWRGVSTRVGIKVVVDWATLIHREDLFGSSQDPLPAAQRLLCNNKSCPSPICFKATTFKPSKCFSHQFSGRLPCSQGGLLPTAP